MPALDPERRDRLTKEADCTAAANLETDVRREKEGLLRDALLLFQRDNHGKRRPAIKRGDAGRRDAAFAIEQQSPLRRAAV